MSIPAADVPQPYLLFFSIFLLDVNAVLIPPEYKSKIVAPGLISIDEVVPLAKNLAIQIPVTSWVPNVNAGWLVHLLLEEVAKLEVSIFPIASLFQLSFVPLLNCIFITPVVVECHPLDILYMYLGTHTHILPSTVCAFAHSLLV
ncbi:hypothetical protein D3C76_803040 [compost metagenome]